MTRSLLSLSVLCLLLAGCTINNNMKERDCCFNEYPKYYEPNAGATGHRSDFDDTAKSAAPHYGIIVDDNLGNLQNERDAMAKQLADLKNEQAHDKAMIREHEEGHHASATDLAQCDAAHQADKQAAEAKLRDMQEKMASLQHSVDAGDQMNGTAKAANELLTMQIEEDHKRIAELERELAALKHARAQQDQTKPIELNDHLADVLRPHIQQGHVELEHKGTYTLIRMTGAYLFPSASHDITPDGMDMLKEIGAVVAQHPEYTVAVIGHTDAQPLRGAILKTYRNNMVLSAARAKHAAQGLIDGGVSKLNAEGVGSTQPIASNITEEDRAKNRRVEIHIGK